MSGYRLTHLDLRFRKPQLILVDRSGAKCVVKLTPSLALLLLILLANWKDDLGESSDRRGAKSIDHIANQYRRLVPAVDPKKSPQRTTMTKYKYRIRFRMREAITALEKELGRRFVHPNIIENVGNAYRIGVPDLVVRTDEEVV